MVDEAQATSSSELGIQRNMASPLPECRLDGNRQTVPRVSLMFAMFRNCSKATNCRRKVRPPSPGLPDRFGVFAAEHLKKCLARAGVNEIIER